MYIRETGHVSGDHAIRMVLLRFSFSEGQLATVSANYFESGDNLFKKVFFVAKRHVYFYSSFVAVIQGTFL